MAKTQTRRTISIAGHQMTRLRVKALSAGIPMSQAVDQLIDLYLDGNDDIMSDARLCASCVGQVPGTAEAMDGDELAAELADELAAEWLERQLAMGRDQHRPVRP